MQEQSIIKYTERVAGEIAARHADAPAAELDLWLRLAHQREAMVSELYERSGVEARLLDGPEGGVRGLIRSVVHSIWAHETSHTRFLSSLRGVSGCHTDLAELQGQLEGWVTQQATAGHAFARLLIALGSSLVRVPNFVKELRRMSLAEWFAFNTELETTARMGYQRILQVAARLGGEGARPHDLGYTFQFDVARILCEENLHAAAFLEMSSWLDVDEAPSPALSIESCTLALHRLCAQHLSAGAVRLVAASESPGLEAYVPVDVTSGSWVSHGGLGLLFTSAGLAVPVAGVEP